MLAYKYITVYVIALILTSGIRFSDGSVLLTIAKDFSFSERPAIGSQGQYILDAPLKIFVLQILPESILSIATLFFIISILPLAVFFISSERKIYVATLTLLFLPNMRISIQNIGVGDGLTIALTVIAALSYNKLIINIVFFILGLWHPQQSFFIFLSWLVASYYIRLTSIEFLLRCCYGVILSLVVFFIYNMSFLYNFEGRSDYLLKNFEEILLPNLESIHFLIIPSLIFFALLRWHPPRASIGVLAVMLLCLVISVLTTDATRVFYLITFPIFWIIADRYSKYSSELFSIKFNYLYAACLLVPAVSWSGLDLFIWQDLFGDIAKWAF